MEGELIGIIVLVVMGLYGQYKQYRTKQQMEQFKSEHNELKTRFGQYLIQKEMDQERDKYVQELTQRVVDSLQTKQSNI